MKASHLRLLAWTFAAFLPKPDDDETGDGGDKKGEGEDYYEILGVAKGATPEDLRKAYKKKSLQLHPDKIAQRSAHGRGDGPTEEEAQRSFQRMKEAYEALSDPKKREVYDALGPRGVKIMSDPGAAMDPHQLLENLANSGCCDRSKIMFLAVMGAGLALLLPILVCAKVDQGLGGSGPLAAAPWIAVLAPLWFFNVVAIFALLAAAWSSLSQTLAVMTCQKRPKKAPPLTSEDWAAWFPLCEHMCAFAAEMFLALKWDKYLDDWQYLIVLSPLYVLEALRLAESAVDVAAVHRDVGKMVTVWYLERSILPEELAFFHSSDTEEGTGAPTSATPLRHYTDLNDEERDYILSKYIIVHTPPRPEHDQDDENEDEEDQAEENLEAIALSPEYQAAMETLFASLTTARNVILFHVPFLVLLVLKLDNDKDGWTWWHVSIPLWVMIVFDWARACMGCCCGALGKAYGDTTAAEIAAAAEAAARQREEEEGSYHNDGEVEDLERVISLPEEWNNHESEGGPDQATAPTTGGPPQNGDSRKGEIPAVRPSPSTPEGNFPFLLPIPSRSPPVNVGESDSQRFNHWTGTWTGESDSEAITPSHVSAEPPTPQASEPPTPQGSFTAPQTPLGMPPTPKTPGGGKPPLTPRNPSPSPVSLPLSAKSSGTPRNAAPVTPRTPIALNPLPGVTEAGSQGTAAAEGSTVSGEPSVGSAQMAPFVGTRPVETRATKTRMGDEGRTIFSEFDDEQPIPQNGDGDEGGSLDSGGYIHEDAFREWEEARVEMEQEAAESTAQNLGKCCWQSFLALHLGLFLGKLHAERPPGWDDDADEGEKGEDLGAKGYSAFWILFPSLLIVGIMLCGCCCSVYCASSMEGLEEGVMNRRGGHDDEDDGDSGAQDDDDVIVMGAPPPGGEGEGMGGPVQASMAGTPAGSAVQLPAVPEGDDLDEGGVNFGAGNLGAGQDEVAASSSFAGASTGGISALTFALSTAANTNVAVDGKMEDSLEDGADVIQPSSSELRSEPGANSVITMDDLD